MDKLLHTSTESSTQSIRISLVFQRPADTKLLHSRGWEPQGVDGSRVRLAEPARQYSALNPSQQPTQLQGSFDWRSPKERVPLRVDGSFSIPTLQIEPQQKPCASQDTWLLGVPSSACCSLSLYRSLCGRSMWELRPIRLSIIRRHIIPSLL